MIAVAMGDEDMRDAPAGQRALQGVHMLRQVGAGIDHRDVAAGLVGVSFGSVLHPSLLFVELVAAIVRKASEYTEVSHVRRFFLPILFRILNDAHTTGLIARDA